MIKVVLFDVGKVLIRFSGPQISLYREARRLKKSGIRVGILSNVNIFQAFLLRLSGAYKGFEPVILSHQEGVKKPNPAIYKLTIKRLSVKPSEIIFIDNREENLKSARDQGLRTIHDVSTKQVIAELRDILQQQNKRDI